MRITTFEKGNRKATATYVPKWDEYEVKFYENGEEVSIYLISDKLKAKRVANDWCEKG